MIRLHNRAAIPAIFLFFALFACNEDTLLLPEDIGAFKIEAVSFPDTVWIKSNYEFIVTVQTAHSGGGNSFSVFGSIQIEGQSNFDADFSLYDDGSHGDNIPNDNQYTTKLSNAIFEGNAGNAQVDFFASTTNNAPYTILGIPYSKNTVAIDDILNTPPILDNLTAPDSVRFETGGLSIVTVQASDSQGLDDILKVTGSLYFPYAPVPFLRITFQDNGLDNDFSAGDGIFTSVIPHDSLRFNGSGEYTLLVVARDEAGALSAEAIRSIFFVLESVETPPEIISVLAPDSLKADNSLVLLQAEVFDANGLSDIEQVFFISIRPDGTAANNGNPFFMYDDGGTISHGGIFSGDLEAGDGIFSLTIQIPSTASKGTYTFKFRAVDKTGLLSPFYDHPIVIY